MALSFPTLSGIRPQHSPFLLRSIALMLLLTLLSSSSQTLLHASNPLPTASDALAFVPNAGQSAPQVLFQSADSGAALFFGRSEVVLALPNATQSSSALAEQSATLLQLNFIATNPETAIVPSTSLPGRFHSLIGNDPRAWYTGLPSYAALSYEQLYPGISMRYEGQAGKLKSTYYVAPGADPAQIRWRYQGAEQLSISRDGSLLLTMPDGLQIVEQAPIAWQELNGRNIPVKVSFVLEADQSLHFAPGAYNPAQTLIIDPTLSYSTYLRGALANTDAATDVAIAVENGTTYAYVTGITYSATFPSGASASTIAPAVRPDIFVTKINPALAGAGSHIYTTLIGGSNLDTAYALVAQNDGTVFIAGSTASSDFPMSAPQTLDTSYSGGATDAFVIGLAPGGASLSFATFLGGTGNDVAYGIDGSSSAGLAVAGVSNSATGFPVASQLTRGGADDAFVLLLNDPLGTPAAGYFSFLGGDDVDGARAVALDNDQMFVTGWTQSFNTDFPVTDSTDKSDGDRDAFVTRIDSTQMGNPSLVYSRLLQGTGDEEGYGIRVNASQQAVVVGTTSSTDFPTTTDSLKATKAGGDDDAFVSVIANTVTNPGLVASTYLGMSGAEAARDMALDAHGNIYVTGSSDSSDFGLSSLQSFGGGSDAYVAKLSPDLKLRLYTSYLGGSGSDISYGIAVDSASQVYIAGQTSSSDYYSLPPAPLTAGFQTTGGGASYSTDGFFAMLTNTAPKLTTANMTVDEGSTTALSATQLKAEDSDDDPAALVFTLSTAPSNGSIRLDPDGPGGQAAQTLAQGDSFTNAQLLAGYVSYVHNGSETISDSFAVTLSDLVNTTAAGTVNITVRPINDPPTINAHSFDLAEKSANGTSVGTLIASDPDSPSLTYSISAGNTGNAFAINSTTGKITVANSAALDYETTPSFSLTVQVSDGALSALNTVTINLTNVNEPPSMAAQEFSIAENSANGTSVGTVAISDPDANDTKTFEITGGNTGSAFAINSSTGEISVASSAALDREITASFALAVKVTDSGNLSASNTVTIKLTDVNDNAPVITSSSFTVPENSANGTSVGTLQYTDADSSAQTFTFSITGGTGETAFSIDANTGQMKVADAIQLDRETTPSFTLDVKISDGVNETTKQLTINLSDVNDNKPTITAPADFAINENTANGTIVGTAIVASDADSADKLTLSITNGNPNNAFTIDPATKQLKVANSAALDYETNPSFTLSIQVSDGTNTATDDVTISLNNLNEPPALNAQTFSIDENKANGSVVGTVAATDQDANTTLTYSITGGNTGNAFAINSSTGEITVNNQAALDYETIKLFSLTVEVSDGPNKVTNTITVNLNNLNDTAPVINDQSFSIAENSANNTVVATVAATDADGLPFSFSITSGNSNNAFAINSTTGEISVANSAALDYETTPSFSLTVQVADGAFTSSATVTINVSNINEAPVLDASGTMKLSDIAEDTPASSNTGTLVADILASAGGKRISDQDTGALEGIAIIAADGSNGTWEFSLDGTTWATFGRLSNTSAVLLAADPTTRVRFLPNANYNGLVDPGISLRAWDRTSGKNGDLQVNVSVNGGSTAWSTATETASITVTSVNDLPIAANDNFSVAKNSTANSLNVLANDSTAPDSGETLKITEVGAAVYGTVQMNAAGDVLIYTPLTDYEGFDSFSYTISDGNGGTATATVQLHVGRYNVMLPTIFGNPIPPDLEITSFTISPTGNSFKANQPVQISVTIKNNGTVHTGGFWVDLYINPKLVPERPNIPWEENCSRSPCYGIAWLVASGLGEGESITLTSTPASYYAKNTSWPGYFTRGTSDLYVYVDSWNGSDPNGAVTESNEQNNRAEIHAIQVTGTEPILNDVAPVMPARSLP